MAPAGCRRFSSRGERTRLPCSVGFVLCPLLDSWSTSLLGEDSGKRYGHVGRVRAPPQCVPPGDLSSEGRLVHQMDRRSNQGTHDQHRQFRRGTGKSDVRRRRHSSTKDLSCRRSTAFCRCIPEARTVPTNVKYFLSCLSRQVSQTKVTTVRSEMHSWHSATSGRTGKVEGIGGWAPGYLTKTPRSLEIQVVQP